MHQYLKTTLAAAALAAFGLGQPVSAQETPAQATFAEIEQVLGFVPEFMAVMPDNGVTGVWTLIKQLELNPDTALSQREKVLIGLAVAAQIPCQYCTYGYLLSAEAAGIDKQEIGEAVAMAGLTRLGSTLLNGLDVDLPRFRTEYRLVAGE